jgi:hypothetical protein
MNKERTMTTHELTTGTAHAIRAHLRLLEQERALAALTGLAQNSRYMADLHGELEAVRAAYAGAVVTEIASLRARLGSPLQG